MNNRLFVGLCVLSGIVNCGTAMTNSVDAGTIEASVSTCPAGNTSCDPEHCGNPLVDFGTVDGITYPQGFCPVTYACVSGMCVRPTHLCAGINTMYVEGLGCVRCGDDEELCCEAIWNYSGCGIGNCGCMISCGNDGLCHRVQ